LPKVLKLLCNLASLPLHQSLNCRRLLLAGVLFFWILLAAGCDAEEPVGMGGKEDVTFNHVSIPVDELMVPEAVVAGIEAGTAVGPVTGDVKLIELLDSHSVEELQFLLNLKQGGAAPLTLLPASSSEMIRLGEALFWDRELGGNRDMACVTCHHPLAGTGDDLSLPVGTGGKGFRAKRLPGEGRVLVPRNAPEIFNRGAEGWETMFWDGRAAGTAEKGFHSPAGDALPDGLNNVVAVQAMFPVTSRDEMRGQNGDLDVYGQPNELALIPDDDLPAIWAALLDRLLAIPGYQALFAAAYPDIPLEQLAFQQAANAIAAYEMSTFTYTGSPWNRNLSGDKEALSEQALQGAALFYGEAGCAGCHNGPLLTDQQFHNIGVPQLGPGKNDDKGFDYGRQLETGRAEDMYAFRTPPLHNVTLTGPWMHNGACTTLEEAVRFHFDPAVALQEFNALQLHPLHWATYKVPADLLDNLDPLLAKSPPLSDEQVADLLAFLEALTDPAAANGCELIPESVPSGLPLDTDPDAGC
jgi:cytochrome c peroxidase